MQEIFEDLQEYEHTLNAYMITATERDLNRKLAEYKLMHGDYLNKFNNIDQGKITGDQASKLNNQKDHLLVIITSLEHRMKESRPSGRKGAT